MAEVAYLSFHKMKERFGVTTVHGAGCLIIEPTLNPDSLNEIERFCRVHEFVSHFTQLTRQLGHYRTEAGQFAADHSDEILASEMTRISAIDDQDYLRAYVRAARCREFCKWPPHCLAIKKIADDSFMSEVARDPNYSASIRSSAIYRVADVETLKEIFRRNSGDNRSSREDLGYYISQSASGRYFSLVEEHSVEPDIGFLKEIILQGTPHLVERTGAVRCIRDVKTLRELVCILEEPKSPAGKRLDDQGCLDEVLDALKRQIVEVDDDLSE